VGRALLPAAFLRAATVTWVPQAWIPHTFAHAAKGWDLGTLSPCGLIPLALRENLPQTLPLKG